MAHPQLLEVVEYEKFVIKCWKRQMAAASEGENGGGGQRGGGGGKRGEKTISAAAGEGKNGGKGRGNQPTEFQPETNSRTHASMEQITSFESSAVSFQPSAQDRAFVVGFWQKAIRNYASLFDDNTEIVFVSSPWGGHSHFCGRCSW
jgi:hypothetical protein